ncbi:MAG: type II secretion system F family protein [Gammaproteobacteria bacterium]|nr:type II secretion system F family protein [Gammaproteobacteria bacterium]
MEYYKYKAMNADGKVLQGRVDAFNVSDLELRLKKMGLDLVNFKQLAFRGLSIARRGVKRRDLITFCFHLEQTSRAGVPILEALTDLRDSVDNPRMREVTSAMLEAIEGGKTLSETMFEFPSVFSDVFANLVKAGERSGQVSEVFRNLAENLKWQDEQVAHTKKLFIYPLFVVGVVIAVLFFLMTYLVPELLKFVQSMGQELPMHTKVLIGVSGIFANYWYIILLVPVVVIVALILAVRVSPAMRYKVDYYKLKIPIFGPLLKKIILTRLANFFAMMYASGITIMECIHVGEEIVGNKAVQEAMRQVGRQIADGASLSASFQATGLFPPLVVRMLKVGETTGALENALLNVSYFYTRDVKESIERLQATLEPAMTVTLGLIVAWVMLSVLGPIYDVITQIKI